jgi:hypothetical protein
MTFPCGAPGREADNVRFKALQSALDERFPRLKSPKGNGSAYWLENCFGDQRHSQEAVCKDNLIRVMRLSAREGQPLLPEPAEVLVEELRFLAKAAGSAKWEPDRDKKIIAREALRGWWDRRTREQTEGVAAPGGGKLRAKMMEAALPEELVELAPARQAVAALVQEEVGAIDMALGELNERQRQLGRISAALGVGRQITDRIAAIEQEIEPLQTHVDEAVRATDFGAAARGRTPAASDSRVCRVDLS